MKVLKIKNNRKINVVSIPIGNIEDITIRALNVLRDSDVIYCENTKNSSIFLSKYSIKKRLESLHKYNEQEKVEQIIKHIDNGLNVSIISDAGTPLVSDPGTFIAKNLVKNDIMIYPIVGASSLTATLSINQYNSDIISFLGFVDAHTKDKIKMIIEGENDILCFVSPHFMKRLMIKINNDQSREVSIFKELTKMHETHIYATTSDFINNYDNINLKGEFTVIFKKKGKNSNVDLIYIIQKYKNSRMSSKEIIDTIHNEYGTKKNEIKKKLYELKEKEDE